METSAVTYGSGDSADENRHPEAADTPAAAAGSRVRIDRLIEVLEEFRKLDPDMPIQYALSFLTLAQGNNLSIRELAENLGIAQSSASRNVAALSEWHSFAKPGHHLVVAREDPRERRRKIVSLTPKGERLLARLEALMSGNRPREESEITRLAPSGGTGRIVPGESTS